MNKKRIPSVEEAVGSKPLGEGDSTDSHTATLLSGEFCPTVEFEQLAEWVRLGASHARNHGACIEEHRQSLRSRGETDLRLQEFAGWRDSGAFTKREKAALNLSQSISLPEHEDRSIQVIKDAGRYFNVHQIVRLSMAILAVNEWIDIH